MRRWATATRRPCMREPVRARALRCATTSTAPPSRISRRARSKHSTKRPSWLNSTRSAARSPWVNKQEGRRVSPTLNLVLNLPFQLAELSKYRLCDFFDAYFGVDRDDGRAVGPRFDDGVRPEVAVHRFYVGVRPLQQ